MSENKVLLKKLRYEIVKRLNQSQIDDAKVDISTYVNFVSDEIVVAVRGFVFAEDESAQHKEVKYPADWWQAWKDRFRSYLPGWFLKRYPIKYTTVSLDAKIVYPNLKQHIPHHLSVVHITKTVESEGEA